ncbi:hypothetical protein Vadar_011739 [Vaccinium darrowii]|uniref:Uncharacterized protein n=1 Tax=Vaccinium darrowii TaxID=229202 RepID=A0ACB7YM42_9ERIC|nr:hypothetical protein Vadar_011739 [Vaccinium darrowii]
MGCCESALAAGKNPHKDHQNHKHQQNPDPPFSHNSFPSSATTTAATAGVPSFSEFALFDLKAATNNFSLDYILSESGGERAPNHVNMGRLFGNTKDSKFSLTSLSETN